MSAGMSWDAEDEADEAASGPMKTFFDERQFLRRQVLDFAFAALFHLLERALQRILHQADDVHSEGVLQGKKLRQFDEMCRVLARCGYDTTGLPFARDLDKLKLISNAVKHGQGVALYRLAKEFPELFLSREPTETLVFEHLSLTPELFTRLAASVADFWDSFPTQQPVLEG